MKARAAAEGVSLAGEAVRPMRDERRRPAWRLHAVHDARDVVKAPHVESVSLGFWHLAFDSDVRWSTSTSEVEVAAAGVRGRGRGVCPVIVFWFESE